MAPPNRGVSKAVLQQPQTRPQNLSRSAPAPASTPVPSSATIVAPHINSTSINDHTSGSSSRTSITIPYPTASAGSLESRTNQLLRDPSLSYIGDFTPFANDGYYPSPATTTTPAAVFPDYQASLSSFSSPVSPAQHQSNLYEPAHPGSLGPLFQGNQPSFQESSMFTDSPNNSTYSSPHSQEQHNYNFADPYSASRYNTTTSSSFMYNPTETAPTTGHSSMSSSDEMETDGNGPFLYTFSDMPLSSAPSPQPQDDDDYVPPAPQLGHPASSKSPSSPFSANKIPSISSSSSKEKEQNKQKLYRNRKSEFTNRMRDELLAMNLLPHSRITHAPEIMSKTADTLRDYRELLLLIRDNVDGMPDNLASVPGAIRKLLNENSHIFNNTTKLPPAPRTVASQQQQQHPKATDYKIQINTPSIQPLPFRATGTGRHPGSF